MVQAFSIGKERRGEISVSPNSKFVPGPGTYRYTASVGKKDDPKWKFGSGKRPGLASTMATKDLGPGAYEIKSRAIEGRQ